MGQNVAPFEVAVGVPEIWIAPAGTAMPDLSVAPAGDWEKLFDRRLTLEDGVTIRAPQTWEHDAFRTAGVTAPLKGALTAEDFEIEVAAMDWSAAAVARALHGPDATVTDTAAGSGTAGNLNFSTYNGPTQRVCAVLVRWPYSTEAAQPTDDFAMQAEIKRATLMANIDTAFQKGAPGSTGVSIRALYDLDTDAFVTIRMQDAAPAGS